MLSAKKKKKRPVFFSVAYIILFARTQLNNAFRVFVAVIIVVVVVVTITVIAVVVFVLFLYITTSFLCLSLLHWLSVRFSDLSLFSTSYSRLRI